MHQWDIYMLPLPNPERLHPCVIVSPNTIIANHRVKLVNVIVCQSLYAGDPLDPTDVRLNGADELDHATVARCQLMMHYKKSAIPATRAGRVCPERRRMIRRKIIEVLELLG